jgi:phosphoserine phosphatase RsbU/P
LELPRRDAGEGCQTIAGIARPGHISGRDEFAERNTSVHSQRPRLNESENVTIRDLQEKNRQLAQAYEELKAAQARLIEKEKLEAEMKIARQIQRSILPKPRPQVSGLDFGMRIEPMESVGGDFFDFIVPDNERNGLLMGDVSDHGVPAAIFMALTYSLLRVEALRDQSPGKSLRTVNQHLLDMNASGMYVTIMRAPGTNCL